MELKEQQLFSKLEVNNLYLLVHVAQKIESRSPWIAEKWQSLDLSNAILS